MVYGGTAPNVNYVGKYDAVKAVLFDETAAQKKIEADYNKTLFYIQINKRITTKGNIFYTFSIAKTFNCKINDVFEIKRATVLLFSVVRIF